MVLVQDTQTKNTFGLPWPIQLSDGLSMTCEIFSLQREINEVIDSSGLCLKASNSLLETSMIVLNANCLKNSWAKSSQVLWRDTSNEANQRYPTPLKDIGKNIIIWALSSPWALMIVL